MRSARSSLATSSNAPSSTPLRPSFHASATRRANCSMVSGWVVGTNSTASCAPLFFSNAARRASSVCCCCASSVAVRSVTRALSGGTGTSACAAPHSSSASRKTRAKRFIYFAGAAGPSMAKQSRRIALNFHFHPPLHGAIGIGINPAGNRFAQVILAVVVTDFSRNITNDHYRLVALQRNSGSAGVGLSGFADYAFHHALLLLNDSSKIAGAGCIYFAGAAALGAAKSTVGGREISFSFSTVNDGFTLK